MTRGSLAASWTARRLNRRRLLASAGAVSAAGAALLTGCATKSSNSSSSSSSSSGAGAGQPKQGGTIPLFLGSGGNTEDFEPHGVRSEGAATQTVLSYIYNGLLRLKMGGNMTFTDRTVEGALASSWEQPDPSTLVFKLKPNVKFHNKAPVSGRTLTSADVKFSYERMLQSPFAYINYFNTINSIEATDPQTVTMKLKSPDASLIPHIAAGFGWIIAKEAGKSSSTGAAGLDFHDQSTAIGTGPFMLDSYQKGIKVSLARNPDYFENGLPYVDRIEYSVISDPASQVAALQTGQVLIGALPAGSEADFKTRNPKMIFNQNPSTSAWHYAGRVDQKPFTDVRVRRALAMAFDQEAWKKIWGTPDTQSSYGSLTAINGDYYLALDKLGENSQYWKLDPQAAKQMLASAGYPNGFETSVNSSNCCGPQFLEDAFASSMAKAGVKVNINIKEHAAYQATTIRGQFDGMADDQVPVYDPSDWFSLTNQPGGVRNIAMMNDSTVNDLFAKQRAELDPKKRLDIVHQLVQYCAGQAYYLVEPQIQSTETHQPYIKNYAPRLGYQPTLMVAWLDKQS
jgi:peptide/nickel transport system substrate-binding protein